MRRTEPVWWNGRIMPACDAGATPFDHVRDYGGAVFDGVKCYGTSETRRFFYRLRDHVRRALRTARVYRLKVPFSEEDILKGHLDLARTLPNCTYFRLQIGPGAPTNTEPGGWKHTVGGVSPKHCPTVVAITADDWKHYFGPDVFELGAGAIVGSYARPAPNTGNPHLKGAWGYAIAQLSKMDAESLYFRHPIDGKLTRCADAVVLTPDGYVAEMTGANLLVRHGALIRTPPLTDNILPGITRDTVLRVVAPELDLRIVEARIPQADLRTADEVVALGSAAEATPFVCINGQPVGNGRPGWLQRKIRGWFLDYFQLGEKGSDRHRILMYVR